MVKNKNLKMLAIGLVSVFSLHFASMTVSDMIYVKNRSQTILYNFRANDAYIKSKMLEEEILNSAVYPGTTQIIEDKQQALEEKIGEFEKCSNLAKEYLQKTKKWKKIRDALAKPYPKSLKNILFPY